MHAPIRQTEVADIVERVHALAGDRVEQTHLDVRVHVEQDEHAVVNCRKYVVQQQAHAHAALSGLEQFSDEHEAGRVRAHQEVLRVDRAFGPVNQREARAEGIQALLSADKKASRSGASERHSRLFFAR